MLPENNYLQNLIPKVRHNRIFEKVVNHIKINQKSIRETKICPYCQAKNLGVVQNCYKCGMGI